MKASGQPPPPCFFFLQTHWSAVLWYTQPLLLWTADSQRTSRRARACATITTLANSTSCCVMSWSSFGLQIIRPFASRRVFSLAPRREGSGPWGARRKFLFWPPEILKRPWFKLCATPKGTKNDSTRKWKRTFRNKWFILSQTFTSLTPVPQSERGQNPRFWPPSGTTSIIPRPFHMEAPPPALWPMCVFRHECLYLQGVGDLFLRTGLHNVGITFTLGSAAQGEDLRHTDFRRTRSPNYLKPNRIAQGWPKWQRNSATRRDGKL